MQVVGKTFKVNTVETPTPRPQTAESTYPHDIPSSDGQGFLGGEGLTSPPSPPPTSSNPLHDFTLGDVGASEGADPLQGDSALKVLEDFPPSLEEVMYGKDGAEKHLDVIKKKYEETIAALQKAEKNYDKTLKDGKIRSHEAEMLQKKLTLVRQAIVKANGELAKLERLMADADRIAREEWIRGIDLNNDGKIGIGPNAIGFMRTEDGKNVALDPKTGEPIAVIHPDYRAAMVHGRGYLRTVEASDKLADDFETKTLPDGTTSQVPKERYDLFLKLNAAELDALAGNGDFSPAKIGVPEALWVEGKNHRAEYDKDGDYKLFNEWDETDGLVQKIPEDRSNYMLVSVAKMEVTSVKAGFSTAGGEPLYHHVVTFKDKDDRVIARLRLEGDFVNGQHPAAAAVPAQNGQTNYIAASTIPVIYTADADPNGFGGRWSALEADTSRAQSTGHAYNNNIEQQLGIAGEMPPATDLQGQIAWNENVNVHKRADFTDYVFRDSRGQLQSFATERTSGLPWQGLHTAQSRFAFVPKGALPNQSSPLMEIRTGSILQGLRGVLKLGNFNDIAIIPDPNETIPEARREELSGGRARIKPGDKPFKTVVEGGLGHNMVIARGGDVIASDITFFHGRSDDGEFHLDTPEKASMSANGQTYTKNPKVFVKAKARLVSLINLAEFGDEIQHANTQTPADVIKKAHQDDRYIIDAGEIYVANYEDTSDLQGPNGTLTLTAGKTASRADFHQLMSTTRQELIDEIEKLPDIKTYEAQAKKWLELNGPAAELDAETDGFFNEMFTFEQTEIEATAPGNTGA